LGGAHAITTVDIGASNAGRLNQALDLMAGN
jgi:hypothetical protein